MDTKAFVVEADTFEELLAAVVRVASQAGKIAVQDSKSGKPYGKLIATGGAVGAFKPSFSMEWPEGISIAGKVPQYANLTLAFTNLQTSQAVRATKSAKAATIKDEIRAKMEEAERLGVDVSDLYAAE
jgi:hypothetical protein